jgi:hypothetical protein
MDRQAFQFHGSKLFDIAGTLFTVALARESFLGAAFLSGLQVKGVPLDFFDNIFLLNFALEPP